MAVKFLKATQVGTLYNEGETAGFDDDVAERLVQQGFARFGKAKRAVVVQEPAEIIPPLVPQPAVVSRGAYEPTAAVVLTPEGVTTEPTDAANAPGLTTESVPTGDKPAEDQPPFIPAKPSKPAKPAGA